MPTKSLHLLFDVCLKREGIVTDMDYSIIHTLVESDFYTTLTLKQRTGQSSIDISQVKSWITQVDILRSDKFCNDFLHIVLGHVLCDFLWIKFQCKNDFQFLKLALLTYKSRGYKDVTMETENQKIDA